MDVDSFLNEIRSSPDYADQIVYVREVAPRQARYADPAEPLAEPARKMLANRDIGRLYSHQAKAIDLWRAAKDLVVASGTASGKSLCYQIPLIELLAREPDARAVLMFPTKALCQDQFKAFSAALSAAGLDGVQAGVYDGDTPSNLRRKLRDSASVIFTNPDMLHATVMPQHGRWANFLGGLRIIVLDELHVYSGMFGANMANLLRRLDRLCGHYGSAPQMAACSATIANPKELADELTGRDFELIDTDGSPRGRRTYVFWNPRKLRNTAWRSRRSANVEAHELMAALIERSISTITFAKSKMTAEMIHRYVTDKLRRTAPYLAGKVSPYRGGYMPAERREIERRLFSGELLGVSTTRALEFGIDVGTLEACMVVGYPGTLASFLQQSGRAGRRQRDALIVLVGMDTTVNQYVMSHPEYLFDRAVEQAVIDPDNPFVTLGHLRCAAHELPLDDAEARRFGPDADVVLGVLGDNRKVTREAGKWYHATVETPQHEMSLRGCADANVMLHDADTGAVLGEINRFDAQPIVHPGAIYMNRGDTWRVLELDLDRNIAVLKREDADYYTNPLGGTDIHHIDHPLREKPFGTGRAVWGEVTAYFNTGAYQKIHFYELEPISVHPVDLPTMVLETTAVWLVPPEELLADVLKAGLEHSGLPGIGYATRMLLPLFMTCDTLDFSHSVGAVNAPWQSVFVYERYPHGLGFTERAYENLHNIMPAVLEHIKACDCADGCPCCVGKPLRQYATWYVDISEAWVPSKASAIMILEGLLGDGSNLDNPDAGALSNSDASRRLRLEKDLRRRLERMREPQVFHPIEPAPAVGHPGPEKDDQLGRADAAVRRERRTQFHKDLRKRLAKKIETHQLDALEPKGNHMKKRKTGRRKPPTTFPGRPEVAAEQVTDDEQKQIHLGDSLAARARRKKKPRDDEKQ